MFPLIFFWCARNRTVSEQPILKPEHFQVSRFRKRQLKGKRCKLPQRGPGRSPAANACILGWEIAASVDEFPSWSTWPYFYMGVSSTFPKLGRVHYGMNSIGLRSGRVQTQDPGGNPTPLAIHRNEINLTVAMCCAELESAARRCLMHCAVAQPHSLEGMLHLACKIITTPTIQCRSTRTKSH